jgi:hypothetical protein
MFMLFMLTKSWHYLLLMLRPQIRFTRKRIIRLTPFLDENIKDCHSLLNTVLKLMRPNVQTNVNAEFAKIKIIKPVIMVSTLSNGTQPWN